MPTLTIAADLGTVMTQFLSITSEQDKFHYFIPQQTIILD